MQTSWCPQPRTSSSVSPCESTLHTRLPNMLTCTALSWAAHKHNGSELVLTESFLFQAGSRSSGVRPAVSQQTGLSRNIPRCDMRTSFGLALLHLVIQCGCPECCQNGSQRVFKIRSSSCHRHVTFSIEERCLYNTEAQLKKQLRTWCRHPHLAREDPPQVSTFNSSASTRNVVRSWTTLWLPNVQRQRPGEETVNIFPHKGTWLFSRLDLAFVSVNPDSRASVGE